MVLSLIALGVSGANVFGDVKAALKKAAADAGTSSDKPSPFGANVPKPFGGAGRGGKGFPGMANGMMEESDAMHKWYCDQEGNAEALPCLMYAVRKAPAEEKAALQEKVKSMGMKGASPDRREAMSKMHDEKAGKPPHHKSEYLEMQAAYCDERPENAE